MIVQSHGKVSMLSTIIDGDLVCKQYEDNNCFVLMSEMEDFMDLVEVARVLSNDGYNTIGDKDLPVGYIYNKKTNGLYRTNCLGVKLISRSLTFIESLHISIEDIAYLDLLLTVSKDHEDLLMKLTSKYKLPLKSFRTFVN